MDIRGRPVVGEALVIAASPFVGYLLTYLYDVGYLGVFNVPTEFIALSLSDVLWWSVAVFTGGSLLIMGGQTLAILLKRGTLNAFLGSTGYAGVVSIVALVAVVIFRHHVWIVVAAVSYAAFNISLYLALTVWQQRHVPGFRAKLLRGRESELSRDTMLDGVFDTVGLPVMLGVLGVVALGGLSFALGTAAALDETTFSVSTSNHDRIALRIFGDRVIWAKLDPRTHRLVSVTLQPVSADHPVQVMPMHLGHLKGLRAGAR